jgi:hypothetical protein
LLPQYSMKEFKTRDFNNSSFMGKRFGGITKLLKI